jgi:hypothetical protein
MIPSTGMDMLRSTSVYSYCELLAFESDGRLFELLSSALSQSENARLMVPWSGLRSGDLKICRWTWVAPQPKRSATSRRAIVSLCLSLRQLRRDKCTTYLANRGERVRKYTLRKASRALWPIGVVAFARLKHLKAYTLHIHTSTVPYMCNLLPISLSKGKRGNHPGVGIISDVLRGFI